MGILYMKGHVLMRWMYLNRSHRKLEWEHAVKLGKYEITHNFFNFDRNIGMLHLKMIVLKRGIQLNKNFSNLSNLVLTTTQNDLKNAHFLNFHEHKQIVISTSKCKRCDTMLISILVVSYWETFQKSNFQKRGESLYSTIANIILM